eukprot:8883743-Ditylum_brightwellii.AAC.1
MIQNGNTQPTRASRTQRVDYDPRGYCWSCGFCVTKDHNSVMCPYKWEGHQEAATRSNTMGGSRYHKNWKFD